jgi:hypothetical protein
MITFNDLLVKKGSEYSPPDSINTSLGGHHSLHI